MINTNKTKLAEEYLYKHTDKKIKVISLDEYEELTGLEGVKEYHGASGRSDSDIFIALNHKCVDIHEQIYIHEVLHHILRFEGYPEAQVNWDFVNSNFTPKYQPILKKIQANFSSVIAHPEIYKRMKNVYELDMSPYFDSLVRNKKSRFNKMPTNNYIELTFANQENILDGLEYFYYDKNQKEKIVKIFKSKSMSAFKECLNLFQIINSIGMYKPSSCRIAAEQIKNQIFIYGEKNNIGIINKVWKSIKII